MLDPAALRIQLLGPFQAWRQQAALIWPTKKCKALFQILLIEPGKLVPAELLMEYLWPDLSPDRAKNNLWVTVSQLRRVLQPGSPKNTRFDFIQKKGEGYYFNSESDYWLDVEEVATFLTSAQSAPGIHHQIKALESARYLFLGDYLEDEPYAEWTQFPRTQWQRRYQKLLADLAEMYRQNGHFKQSSELCREILLLDSANETACRLLMRCLVSLKEIPGAIKVYQDVAQSLSTEFDIDPMPETTDLLHQIHQLDRGGELEIEDWTFSSIESAVSTPCVGRGMEITQFSKLLSQTSAGKGQTAVVSGEAGIGKSRLIQEMTIIAHQQGYQTFNAQCFEVEQTLPYQPLINLVRQIITNDNRWQTLAPVWLRELAVLVPEMEEVASSATTLVPSLDELDESQQGRLFQAICHLFANQAEVQKSIIVVDDIHWAGPTTLLCLHYLTRYIAPLQIALILSYREENLSANAGLVTLLNSLQREDHVTLFPITRLTKTDIGAFLTHKDDTAHNADRLSNWLYQETDGNPLFFISLIQSLREEGLLEIELDQDWFNGVRTDPDLTLPEAIRVSVRDRLHRLSESERDVLDWMAVFGRRIDFHTLQKVNDQSKISLLNTVEQLAAKQQLVEIKGDYEFAHNKIREVVYHDLSAARRTHYHHQIGSRLEKLIPSTEHAAILAHHFECGHETTKAAGYWMNAGEHALDTYAYQQAVQHFERALALTDSLAPQMDAYLGLGRAFTLSDDYTAAAAVIQQGLQLAEKASDKLRRTLLLYAQAENANHQHPPDGGKLEVEAALTAAEQTGNDKYLALSLLLLTEVHESDGDLGSALETADRAQVTGHKLKDKLLEARALLEIGFLHAQRADFNKAVSAADLGLQLLAGTDDRKAVAYAWNILGRAYGGCGDYSRAFEAFDRSQEEAGIIGDRYLLAQVFNMKGWLHRELGDYEKGLKFDQEGIESANRWDKPSPEISARLNLCLDLWHLGDPKKVMQLLDDIEKQISAGLFGFHSWRWRLRLLHIRGLCLLALDKPAEVVPLAEEGLQLAEIKETRKYIALNHELMGLTLTSLGKRDQAARELKTAVILADEIQYQPIRWADRFHLAKLYQQNNQPQAAVETTSEAEVIIQAIAGALKDESLQSSFLNMTQSQYQQILGSED
jgi:predicted ATPase/DNA-binding SARP family transcriptional activator